MARNPLGNSMRQLSDVAKMVLVKPTLAPERQLKLDQIYTTVQVRKKFRNLYELAASVKELGIIEPLVVHEDADGRYRLIIGERRYLAAPLAGLTEVPVVIKRGLTEEQIRALQVAENNVRDDLTPFEKIMGVIEDVTKYGIEAAKKIWNVTSDGWISKRMTVKKYLPVTLSILEDELSGDLEVLGPINKIERLDAEAAKQLRAQLERGETVDRDTVRGKLAMLEVQIGERSDRVAADGKRSIAPSQGEENEDADAGGPTHSVAEATPSPATTARPATNIASTRPVSKIPSVARNKPDAQTTSVDEMTKKGARLYEQRVELFEYGRDNEDSFHNLQALMSELGHTADEGEWAMWVGFQDMVLPMLDRLGDARSKAYLKRLLGELKGKAPARLWQELHPGADLNDGSKEGVQVPPMPEGWKF
jgi:ParB family chromosome partitioning protein